MTTLLAEQQREGMLPVVADDLLNDVAFSPNGKLLATADYADGTVRLWNMSTGRPATVALRADTGLAAGVSEVAFSPDGRLLATADYDGSVRLWNAATGQLIRSLPADVIGGESTHGVAFSPDGRLLAAASLNGTVRLWNLATGQPVRSLLADPNSYNGLTGVAFSPDGSLLATASSDGGVRLWLRSPAARTESSFGGGTRPASDSGVNGMAFNPGRPAAGHRRRRRERPAVEPGHRPTHQVPPRGQRPKR